MKIYAPPQNHIISKITFTAAITKEALIHEEVSYAHKHKQFQDQHPLFTLPALETPSHQYIFGTHAIMRKLAPKNHALSPFEEVYIQ